MQRNKARVLESDTSFNPTTCVNCCANWNADTNGVARWGEALYATFRRVQSCDPGPPTSHGGCQQCSGHDYDYIRELAYSKLKKELSHVGFVSMTLDQAAQFYKREHGKQLCATRDVVMCRDSEGGEDHHLRD